MKKVLVFATAALLISGAAFAGKEKKCTKNCCKDKKENCSKEKEKKDNCCKDKKDKETKEEKKG